MNDVGNKVSNAIIIIKLTDDTVPPQVYLVNEEMLFIAFVVENLVCFYMSIVFLKTKLSNINFVFTKASLVVGFIQPAIFSLLLH